MWEKMRGRQPDRELETALRRQRPEPSEEFVRGVVGRLEGDARGTRVLWSRVAFAGALATVVLGMFASVGGIGYAASGARDTYRVVRSVVVQHKLKVAVHKSSAQSQYQPTPRTPSKPAGASFSQAAGAAEQVASGSLPFTGLSLVTTVLVALALLVAGLALRRRESRS